jgi:Domain of unknown function (DUF4249)
MKKINIIAAVLGIMSLTACEKVVNVDVKNSDPKIVIEGSVDDNGNPAKVVITKSGLFSANNNFPKVNGAVVKITDNVGNNYTLTETSSGVYTNNTLVGVVGRTYNLTATVAGVTYTASSTMPRKMALDTIEIENNVPTGGPTSAAKVASLVYQDLPGFGDNAHIVVTVNGIKDRNLYISDDLLTDGGIAPFYLYNPNIKLKAGDVFKAELRFIDKNVYKYLSGVGELSEGNTVPSNPISNLSNGALGYFSAHTSETKTIIVQ